MTTDCWDEEAAEPAGRPVKYGIDHYRKAEELVDGLPREFRAVVCALLALAAPLYGLHQPPFRPEVGHDDTLATNKINKPNGSEW